MKFHSKAEKGSVHIDFIEGSLNRFDGKTLSVGYGAKKPLSRRKFVLTMRKAVSVAKQNKIKSVDIRFADIKVLSPKDFSDSETGTTAAVAFVMAAYEHTTYKTKTKDAYVSVEGVAVTGATAEAAAGLKKGLVVGQEVNVARELSNMPGGDMTPKVLANAAKAAAKGTTIKVTVLGRKEMTKLGMGGVLGVGKGAADEPQFIVMEYRGAGTKDKPVVLCGKGVTFDSGGQQVKPGDHMYEMHMDMSGGAAVIHAVALAAKLRIKTNVVGLVPAVENATGPDAMRPGDILKSLSGKTIEVLHTDAEGRVILADAITYAKRFNPAVVADVATLTGASLIALGEQASAIMMNDASPKTLMEILDLSESSGDYMWPFPLWESYDDMVRGRFGDVPNIPASGNTRYAGVIGGGKFLEVFAKELDCLWMHIDMAPKMTAAPNEFLAKGAAGAPVRFLLALIEHYANRSSR